MANTDKYQAYQNLFDAKLASQKQQKADARAAGEQNISASESEFFGSKAGAIGLGLIGFALTGNPLIAALAAGAGSYAGGKLASEGAGGYADEDFFTETPFYQESRKDLVYDAESIAEGAESGRLWSSLSDAFSAYTLSGGAIPGTSGMTTGTEIAKGTSVSKEVAGDMIIKEATEEMGKGAATQLAQQTLTKLGTDDLTIGALNDALASQGYNFDKYAQISGLDVIKQNMFNPSTMGKGMWDMYMSDLESGAQRRKS